jgi:hypothetical protein
MSIFESKVIDYFDQGSYVIRRQMPGLYDSVRKTVYDDDGNSVVSYQKRKRTAGGAASDTEFLRLTKDETVLHATVAMKLAAVAHSATVHAAFLVLRRAGKQQEFNNNYARVSK